MYDPRFWQRFRIIAWLTIALTLGIAYLALSGYTVGLGLIVPSSSPTASGLLPPPDRGTVEGVVCDVFGNVIPGAKVEILDAVVTTDYEGRFRVDNVPLGPVQLLIKAEGFQDSTVQISVEPGVNYPQIVSDTGLWPTDFSVRFHAFTNSLETDDTQLLFGLVEIANPRKEAVLLSQIEVRDPNWEVVYDLLESEAVINHISQTYDLQVVTEPVPAYLIPPQGIVVLELDALPKPTKGKYHLWLVYAAADEHRLGRFQVIHIADEMEFDPNLDPHIP